jgi:hypothetical protein
MKNLLNFFFSFDKLFKEKLIVPFFWLALITWGLGFFSTALESISLGPLAKVFDFVQFFISILFALVIIRLISELAVAVFRINDNLSPDGGKSELADIDPVAEARKAAEMAAARTREATKTVSEKASAATKSVRDNVDDMADTVQAKAKSATASVREKTAPASETTKADPKSAAAKVSPATAPKKRGRPAGSKNKPKTSAAKPAASKATPKKRGRPAGSTNKKPAAKTTKPSTGGKRGPKPGTKVPRDADGNLLKKDGTPRKKPGPKKS